MEILNYSSLGDRDDTKAYIQRKSIFGSSFTPFFRLHIRDCGDRPRFEFDSDLHYLMIHDNYAISFVLQCGYL